MPEYKRNFKVNNEKIAENISCIRSNCDNCFKRSQWNLMKINPTSEKIPSSFNLMNDFSAA